MWINKWINKLTNELNIYGRLHERGKKDGMHTNINK